MASVDYVPLADIRNELGAVWALVKSLPSQAWQVRIHNTELTAALSGGRRTTNKRNVDISQEKLPPAGM